MSTPDVPSGADSLESLKRLKEAETQSELALRTVRGEGEALLQKLREEAEQAVRKAQTEGEQQKTDTVERARQAAETEAGQIVTSAEGEIAKRPKPNADSLDEMRDSILDILFGEFRGDRKN
jgi:vacuolar-type H+-ATPase subunit H